MVKSSESGHYKVVTNFDELISVVLGYGTTYDPSKSALTVQEIQALATRAKNSINAVDQLLPPYSSAVAEREAAFDQLGTYTTRILNALRASDAPTQIVDTIKSIVRKIQGTRATPYKTEEEKKSLAAKGVEVKKEISSSQMSFDGRLENFNKMVIAVESIPEYAPNEADLQVAAIRNYYTRLAGLNAAVINAYVALSNARLARNEVLYSPKTGLVDIALDVKAYVKSIFGASSPLFKQISKIEFKNIKS